jgi:nucleoside-diphosphate-sugar epimerase
MTRRSHKTRKGRVLVTGANGYIGAALVKALRSGGYEVSTSDIEGEHTFCGDLTDHLFVDHLLASAQPDIIVHSAALVPLTRRRRDYDRVNADATAFLAAAARREGVSRFTLIGSSAVYGRPRTYPITPQTETRPVEAYGRSKLAAESSALAGWGGPKGLTVIRPRTVLGPNRMGIFDVLFRWVRKGNVIPLPGGGANYLQFVHIDDVARLTVHLLDNSIDGIWPAGAPDERKLATEIDDIIRISGTSAKILPVSPILFRLLAYIADHLHVSIFQPFHYLTIDSNFAYADTWKPEGFNYQRSSAEALRDAYQHGSTPSNSSPHTRSWATPLLDFAMVTLSKVLRLVRPLDRTADAHSPVVRSAQRLATQVSAGESEPLAERLTSHLRRCPPQTRLLIILLTPFFIFLKKSRLPFLSWVAQQTPFSLVNKLVVAHTQSVQNADALIIEEPKEVGTATGSSTRKQTLYHRQNRSIPERVETLIIGSGPGAASAALVLAELGQVGAKDLLVVERGARSVVPQRLHHSIEHVVRDFASGGSELCLSWPLTQFAQGSTFGGGSEVNSGLYHQLPEDVVELWAQQGRFDPAAFQHAQSRISSLLNVDELPQELREPNLSPVARAALELGLAHRHIPRWRSYHAKSYTHYGVSSCVWDVTPFEPENFTLNTTVERLNPEADGIRVSLRGPEGRREIIAGRVIVAAGTTGSARLLLRSGLVERNEISFGFHPMLRVVAAYDTDSYGRSDVDPFQAWSKDGIFKFGGGVSTSSMLAATLGRLLDASEVSTLRSVYLSFVSSGRGGLLPGGQPYYRYSRSDRVLLEQGAQQLLQFVEAGGGKAMQSHDLIKNAISTVHVFGSLPLGSSMYKPGTSLLAVDDRIGVYDASVLPSAPGVNPQGPLMALVLELAKQQLR